MSFFELNLLTQIYEIYINKYINIINLSGKNKQFTIFTIIFFPKREESFLNFKT